VKEYKIPVAARANIGESKAIAMEIIDEVLGKCLGIHLLEPQISMREKNVVKLANQSSQRSNGAYSHGYTSIGQSSAGVDAFGTPLKTTIG